MCTALSREESGLKPRALAFMSCQHLLLTLVLKEVLSLSFCGTQKYRSHVFKFAKCTGDISKMSFNSSLGLLNL